MFLRLIFEFLLRDSIRRPLVAVLNRVPALKQVLVRTYFALMSGRNRPKGSHGPDVCLACNSGFSASYIKVLDMTLEKNGFNPLHTRGVNRIFRALKSRDPEGAARIEPGETRTDLIAAAYLFTLRRYPGPADILTWTDHLDRGATVHTIVGSLINSQEFHANGACGLDTE